MDFGAQMPPMTNLRENIDCKEQKLQPAIIG